MIKDLTNKLVCKGIMFDEKGKITNSKEIIMRFEEIRKSSTLDNPSLCELVDEVIKDIENDIKEYNNLLKKEIKTNKLNYNNGQCIISYELYGRNDLKISIHKGRVNLSVLLNILIQEIDCLREYRYKRVSPYRIEHERPRDTTDKSHVYNITFIDVKNNNKIQKSEIIKLSNCMTLEIGEYKYFIPDLLEVARERGMTTYEDSIYKSEPRNSNYNIEYMDNYMSKENLKKNDWIVPVGYVEKEELYVIDNNLAYSKRIVEIVDIFIDQYNNVLKNRCGERTIKDVLLVNLEDKSIAIENSEYIEIFTSEKNEKTLTDLILSLAKTFGHKSLKPIRVIVRK